MKISALELSGAYLIEPERSRDLRGYFVRVFSADDFGAHGLVTDINQSSLSHNDKAGTLRGLHWQAPPHGETKYIRCLRGRIFDVIVDLREQSATRLQWVGVELSAENDRVLYVPAGFAHGFQTLESDCDVLYQISEPYHPESARGLRWDDPAIGVTWPLGPPSNISEQDRTWPHLEG